MAKKQQMVETDRYCWPLRCRGGTASCVGSRAPAAAPCTQALVGPVHAHMVFKTVLALAVLAVGSNEETIK